MKGIVLALLWSFVASGYAAAPPQPVDVQVFGNHVLDDASIVKMSGVDQDPSLSATEVRRRLQTTSLFSRVSVTRDATSMDIIVVEKTTWFVLPYFSSDSDTRYFGFAGGKSSVLGQNGNAMARYQFGTGDHEGSVLLRDEFFLNSRWIAGASFDYEDALHRIYRGRDVVQWTTNQYHGGSIQFGYHLAPAATLNLNTYIERHRFEDPTTNYTKGVQVSHRVAVDYGSLSLNEGLARGRSARLYFESTNPASTFSFRKVGLSAQLSMYLKGNLNWIMRPRFESGANLPYYQLFELGGWKLRSFPGQEFRAGGYVATQNDVLFASLDLWKFKFRPLVYGDWAFIQGAGRTGVGTGLQLFFQSVVVPALQLFAGYGFNPGGFAITASIGPQF